MHSCSALNHDVGKEKKMQCIMKEIEAEEKLDVVPTLNPRKEALEYLLQDIKDVNNNNNNKYHKRPCFVFVCQGDPIWEGMCVTLATTLRAARPSAEIFVGVPRSHPQISRTTHQTLSKLNVSIGESGNPLDKWDDTYLIGNKIGVLMQASANGCSEHATHIVLLDTDVIDVSLFKKGDSRMNMLLDRSIHVPVAGHADASRVARWSDLYGVLNLAAPSIEITSLCSKEKMPLYYSSGMIVMPRDSDLATMWMLTARTIAQDMSLGTWTWKDSGRPQLMFLLDQYSLIVALEALRLRRGIEHVAMSDNSIHCVLNCHSTKASRLDAFEKAIFVHYQQISNLCHVQSSFLSVLRDANELLRSVLAPVR